MDQARPTIVGRGSARDRQRGEGRLVAIFWLCVLVWCFLAAFEFVPKRYRVSQFSDAITEAAENAGRRSEKSLRTGLLWQAGQLDLPIKEDDLKVDVSSDFVKIEASYTMPVNLPFYRYDWDVRHEIRRRIFRF